VYKNREYKINTNNVYAINIREYRRGNQKRLENTKGAIKKGRSREIGNTEYTKRRKTKQNHNTICVGHRYAQTNTNNVNKTCTLIQTTGGKDEPNIFLCGNFNGRHNTEPRM
jgi:hypothetical protein